MNRPIHHREEEGHVHRLASRWKGRGGEGREVEEVDWLRWHSTDGLGPREGEGEQTAPHTSRHNEKTRKGGRIEEGPSTELQQYHYDWPGARRAHANKIDSISSGALPPKCHDPTLHERNNDDLNAARDNCRSIAGMLRVT